MGNSSSLENKVDEQKKQIKNQNNQIKNLKEDLNKSNERILNLINQQTETNNLQNQAIRNIKTDSSVNQSNINQNLNKINEWQDEYNKVRQSVSANKTDLINQGHDIDDLIQATIIDNPNDLASIRSDIRTNSDNISTNSDNISTNIDNINKNRQTASAIQGNVSGITDNLAVLEDNIGTNRDNIDENRRNINKNRQTASAIQGNVSDITDNLAVVNTRVQTLDAENTIYHDDVRTSLFRLHDMILENKTDNSNQISNSSTTSGIPTTKSIQQAEIAVHPIVGAFQFQDNQIPHIEKTVLTIGLNRGEGIISFCNNTFRLSQGLPLNTLQFIYNYENTHQAEFNFEGNVATYSTKFIQSSDGNVYNDFLIMRLAVKRGGQLIDHYMMALSILNNKDKDLFIYRQYLPNNNVIPTELKVSNIVSTVNLLKLKVGGPQIISKTRVGPGDVVTYIAERKSLEANLTCSNLPLDPK